MAFGTNENTIQFYRAVPEATHPMPADQSALGQLPVAAFQYCEAIRAATSFGWYLFPLTDIYLRWDGAETWSYHEDDWQVLGSQRLSGSALQPWLDHAPDDLKESSPSYLSGLFVPGLVQIWTGLFVATDPAWSLHVRPLANVVQSHAYFCYEGIIETDEFRPCPLFINIRLMETDRDIVLPKSKPLFQAQPLPRAAYVGPIRSLNMSEIATMTPEHWNGVRGTIRTPGYNRPPGAYAARTRRRAKQEG